MKRITRRDQSPLRPSVFPGRVSARRGLTLIEVLIVIAILLAIGGLVIVNLWPQKEHADIDTQKLQLQQIESALSQFRLDMKRYPSDDEGLTALWDKSVLANEDEMANWRGAYLTKPILKDTWGSELIYHYPGERNEQGFDLISLGPDKQEGTADDITTASASQGTAAGNADTGDQSAPPAGDVGG